MTSPAFSRVPVRTDADARHNLSADAFNAACHVVRNRSNGFHGVARDWSRAVIASANDLIDAGRVSPPEAV
jgi:hypothetical protein